jgi:hypothetical protein
MLTGGVHRDGDVRSAVIVRCPSCHTQYRYCEPVAVEGAQARCSKCDGTVPLVALRHSFVLRAQVAAVTARVPVGAGMAIGMDDPGLASSLYSTALDGDGAVDSGAMTYRVLAPEQEAGPASAPPSSPPQVEDSKLEPHISPAVEPSPVAELSPAVEAEESRADSRPAPRRRGRRLLPLLLAVFLTGLGAAAGHYATMYGLIEPLRVHPTVEPVSLTVVGGLLGVFLAWAGVRWTSRTR